MSAENQANYVSMPTLEAMLEIQQKAFQSSLKLFVEDIRSEVKDIRKELHELKDSVTFVSSKYDQVCIKTKAVEGKISAVFIQMEGMNKDINRSLQNIENQHEYLENQSRRNNVKIFGIPEDSSEKTWEDTEVIVKDTIKNKLGMEDEVLIERAHRVGKKVMTRPQSGRHLGSASGNEEPSSRPIVTKIVSWKVKENILKMARQKKPKDIQFKHDFSQRTLDKRAAKIPRMLQERRKGNTAFLVMDKLIVYDQHGRRKFIDDSDDDDDDKGDQDDDDENEVIIRSQGGQFGDKDEV